MAKYLSTDLYESLRYYKEDGYGEINSELRSCLSFNDLDKTIKKHVENIDSVMKPGNSLVLYRGFHNIDSYFSGDVSSIIVDQAYSSCSTDISVSAKFTENMCCIIKFYLPEEIKRYEYKDKKYESEVLLERNLKFQILEAQEFYKGIRVHFAIVTKFLPPVINPEVIEKTKELIEDSVKIEDVVESIVDEILEEDFLDKSNKEELKETILLSIEQRKTILPPTLYDKMKQNIDNITELVQEKIM
jgi:hypothetical protein